MIRRKKDRVDWVMEKLKNLTITFDRRDIDLVYGLTASDITAIKNRLKIENPDMAAAIYHLKLPYSEDLKFEVRGTLIILALMFGKQDKRLSPQKIQRL